MASAAANLARVRLIEIDWSVDVAAYDVLMRLKSIYGIDDDGYSVEGGVITGSCYFRTITQSKYDRVSAALPGVTFTYGELLQEVTITFKNDDGTVLYVTTTERGGRVTDPVTAGIIPTPTKDSTVTTVYTYYNWDCSLDYFTADTVVTAIFSESARTYTVRFLDYDDTVLETVTEVAVYSGVTYSGEDLDRQGYIWTGWDTDTSSVTADLKKNFLRLFYCKIVQNNYLASRLPLSPSSRSSGRRRSSQMTTPSWLCTPTDTTSWRTAAESGPT